MKLISTDEFLEEGYLYKVKIVGHVESTVGEYPQYIAVSHGKIFNLVSCGAVYTSEGKEDIIGRVEIYEMNRKQLHDICEHDEQFNYYIPFDKVPYKDSNEYSKYKKTCFDNFDIFEIDSAENRYMRVNLCWKRVDRNKLEESILKYVE